MGLGLSGLGYYIMGLGFRIFFGFRALGFRILYMTMGLGLRV